MKHKHCELIKAWADGANIECRGLVNEEWYLDTCPTWNPVREYRIKPEPKPDVVFEEYVSYSNIENDWNCTNFGDAPNLKLTFDGETGELWDAKVLK